MKANNHNIYRLRAEVIKAIAHPIRLAILDCLRNGEVCVCEIADEVEAERSNVSRHLAVMVNAGVLSCRKEGLMVYYKLRCPCILKFLGCIETVLRQQHEELGAALKQMS